MAPRARTKCKRKEPIRFDSPLRFDSSSYPFIEAFKRYSTRTITFGRIVKFDDLTFMDFNQLMRRMTWLTFARLTEPCYPNLIRRFYANLVRPNPHKLDMRATIGDSVINLDIPTMCHLLGAHDEGDEVYDSNSWPILPNFNPQQALRRLCKPNTLSLKPKSKDLTLEARLVLLFVQHNILPRGGHMSEPSYFDLWLVDSILSGRKVNLGYLILQHMANVLSSTHSVLPYGMILSTVFQAFDLNLDSESDIRVSKRSDAIDCASISRLGYEYVGGRWVEKGRHAPARVDLDTDEEAEMDIPPPSPTAPAYPHVPTPAPPTHRPGTGSSSTPPDWYQSLSQRIDTIAVDIQQLHVDHQHDIRQLREAHQLDIRQLSAEHDRRFREIMDHQTEMMAFMRSQYPPPPPPQ